ncbi:MAG: hypothetical protein ACPG5B_15155 [Chitinophagales bacterium]
MKTNNSSTILEKESRAVNPQNSSNPISKIMFKTRAYFKYYFRAFALLFATFALLFMIRYPSKITHHIALTTTQPPQYVLAKATGNLMPLVANNIYVEKNEVFAIIENEIKYEHILQLKYELNAFKRLYKSKNMTHFHSNLPYEPQLGHILPYYQAFQHSLSQFSSLPQKQQALFQNAISLDEIAKEQIAAHKKILKRLDKKITPLKHLQDTSVLLYQECYTPLYTEGIVNYNGLFLQRQTIVNQHLKIGYLQNYITQNAHLMSHLDDYQFSENLTSEKFNTLLILETHYNELVNKIQDWEKQYVLKAPLSGKLQYIHFNQKQMQVQKYATIANIVSTEEASIFGEMKVSQREAQKMKQGNKVKIELTKYPAKQFGYIDGELMTITNIKEKNYVEIFIWLPNNLTTSKDSLISYQKNLHGKASISTSNVPLFKHIFGL